MKNPDIANNYKVLATKDIAISPGLRVQYVQNLRGIWQIHLIIEENTTSDEIKDQWYKIIEYRENIISYRGKNFDLFHNSLFANLINLQKSQKKFKNKLCQFELNFNLLIYSYYATDDTKQGNYHSINKEAALTFFELTMMTFGFDKKEIKDYLKLASTTFYKNKNLPWGLNTGPITQEKVWGKIRYQRKKLDLKSENTGDEFFKEIETVLLLHHYWEKTKNLIKEKHPNDFSFYKKRLEERIKGLILTDIPSPY